MKIKKDVVSKKIYLFLNFVYSSFMIFYESWPSIITSLITIIFVVGSLSYLRKKIGIYHSLVFTSIAMIPTSYISILGGTTSEFSVAMFHLLVIIATIFLLFGKRIDKLQVIYVSIFVIYGICNSLMQVNVFDSLKQVLMMLLCYFAFWIGEVSSKDTNVYKRNFLYEIYIAGTISFAMQILLQYFVHKNWGIEIGSIGYYAYRTAYAGLMQDYSFATVYLASGFVAILLKYFEYRTINLKNFLLVESVLMFSMMIISSRTGLYALVITVVLYFLTHMNRFRIRYLVLIFAAIISVPILINVLFETRGGQALFDDSGRMLGFLNSLECLVNENVLLGLGFGLQNLSGQYGLTVPHNFFVQYLVQAGIFGLLIIMLPFFRFIGKMIKSVDCTIWLFVLVSISAMAIPDIMSSRFLYGIIVLNYMSCLRKE